MTRALLELYADLRTAGIEMHVVEGELRLTPAPEPDSALCRRVEELKGELTALLGTSDAESQRPHTERESVRRTVDSGTLIGWITLKDDEELWFITSKFKRQSYLNIRKFVRSPRGKFGPTKKGITVNTDLIPEIMALVRQAEMEIQQ
jgi:hypothetical protein